MNMHLVLIKFNVRLSCFLITITILNDDDNDDDDKINKMIIDIKSY